MKWKTTQKSLLLVLSSITLFMFSCKKDFNVVNSVLPIINYSYWIYDSVEGVNSASHFEVSRMIEITYDPNADRCYMDNDTSPNVLMDTFERSPYWKRGYTNIRDFKHRIIFNVDTITIHYPPPLVTTPGNGGFRYTSGLKL